MTPAVSRLNGGAPPETSSFPYVRNLNTKESKATKVGWLASEQFASVKQMPALRGGRPRKNNRIPRPAGKPIRHQWCLGEHHLGRTRKVRLLLTSSYRKRNLPTVDSYASQRPAAAGRGHLKDPSLLTLVHRNDRAIASESSAHALLTIISAMFAPRGNRVRSQVGAKTRISSQSPHTADRGLPQNDHAREKELSTGDFHPRETVHLIDSARMETCLSPAGLGSSVASCGRFRHARFVINEGSLSEWGENYKAVISCKIDSRGVADRRTSL